MESCLASSQRIVIGVAEAAVSANPGDLLITHALGSCLGITAYDPVARVGGMLHVMLPLSTINPEKAREHPYMFVDSGVPAFFRELYAAGGQKNRLAVKVAGGACVGKAEDGDRFAIGKRNAIVLKKVFWTNGVLIDGEDVGGAAPRTLHLEIGSGRVWVTTAGVERDL